MEIPQEVAVMTLPNATLFPQALLPLYIFEPRYRRMLADALASNRMFVVAMQKPGRSREIPSNIAGLGLIRVCVQNPDRTSHLILQGLTRVEVTRSVAYRPYRKCHIRPLQTPPTDSVTVDALIAKVRDLVTERIQLGFPASFPFKAPDQEKKSSPGFSMKEIARYLEDLNDADQLADIVSCALLPDALERQTILETIEIEPRLKHLIHFLLEEIREHRKKTKS